MIKRRMAKDAVSPFIFVNEQIGWEMFGATRNPVLK